MAKDRKMRNLWISITLIATALAFNIFGILKETFLPKKIPRWFLFVMAIPAFLGAMLQIYQDIESIKIDKETAVLASGIISDFSISIIVK